MKHKSIIFYVAIALFSLFWTCASPYYDYDLFAKLVIGERFVENGIFPYQDFYSYTPTHTWFDHEWGSGVVFYLLLKYLGPFGLIFIQSLLLFLTSVFIVKIIKLRNKNCPVSLLYIAVFVSSIFYSSPNLVRCHLFSFLFISIFIYILEKYRKTNSKLIWAIPFITVLWNNLHGGILAGLGILFLYIVSLFIERKFPKQLILILAISSGLLLLNPYGIDFIKYLVSATTMNRSHITEWWPFYHKFHGRYYVAQSFIVIAGFILNIIQFLITRKKDYAKIIVLAVTIYIGLAHVKLIPISLITIAVYSYDNVLVLTKRFRKTLKTIEKCTYIAIFSLALSIPLYSPNYARSSLGNLPLYEVEFLKINNIKGNIVAPFGYGSYVAYKLYPDNKIFFDGRYEAVYYEKEYDLLRDFYFASEHWNDIFLKYPTDILMPRKTSPVYNVLVESEDWVHIFDGKLCGIFIKKEDVKSSYLDPEYGVSYYRRTMFKHDNWNIEKES